MKADCAPQQGHGLDLVQLVLGIGNWIERVPHRRFVNPYQYWKSDCGVAHYLRYRCRARLISDTTYNQTPVSQEWKKGVITILGLTGSSSQMLITYQIQSLCVWARDKNVLPSDVCKYQTFVPNFRQLLPSPLWIECDKALSGCYSCRQYSDAFVPFFGISNNEVIINLPL